MAVSVHQGSEPKEGTEGTGIRETTQLGRLMEVLAQEAIAVDETEAGEHKGRLRQLSTSTKPDLEKLLQLELRTYRESAEKRVEALRKDLAGTADALQEYVTRFSGQDESQEKLLKSDLERLGALRSVTDVSQIQAGLDIVRESISGTVEQIKNQNKAIIAQLRDEIRTLQKRLESPERRDAQTGTIINRAPFERRIRAKVNAHEIFSMYLIRITNWKDVISSFDQDESQTLVTSVGDKLAGIMGSDTFTGRWYDGYFAAIIGVDKRTAMEGASDVAQQLAGVYTTDRAQVAVRIRVAVVDHIQGHNADQTLGRIDQLIRAFEG